jgi:DNA polymerase-3 subunit epsilon
MANLMWIDVETTGLGPNCAVIEVALVPYIDGEIKPHFKSYIRPHEGAKLEPKAFEINKIDINSIWEFPSAEEIIKEIIEFVDSYQCVFSLSGHNVAFDAENLYKLFCRNGEYGAYINRFRPGGVCTLSLCKRVFKGKRNSPNKFGLSSLCKFFDIELLNAHSALCDVLATIKVYEKILPYLSIVQIEKIKNLDYQSMKRKYMDDGRYVQRNPDGTTYFSAEAMTNDVIRNFIFSELNFLHENSGHLNVLETFAALTIGE